MAKQTFTTGQVLTAAQQNSLQANDFNQTVSVKTANYSLLAADKGTRIEFNTSGSVTCTVNSGEFDAGDTLIIQNRGAGTATITAGTATVNTSASLALAQYSAGTLYFVSDSAALFFGDAAGISASIVDAKGDLIVGTADNTVARLAVGTNGHTLVADSSVSPTGLKWAAPAAGGSLTLLSTTSLSGTTNTISISASSYTNLFIMFRDIRANTNNTVINLRLNGDTGNNYYYSQWRQYQGASNFQSGQNQPWIEFSNQIGTSSGGNAVSGSMDIYRCNDTSQIPLELRQFNFNDSNQNGWYHTLGKYMATAAISSISLIANSTNTLSGTVYVYGVN